MKLKILVAGGSRGLGAAAVHYFQQRGFLLDVAYRSAVQEAKRLESLSGVRTFQADLSSQEGCEDFLNFARAGEGTILALLAVLGTESYGLYDTVPKEEIERVFQANFMAAAYLAQGIRSDLLAAVQDRLSPSILFVSSVWGQCGASMESFYSAAKAANIGFAKSLAKELGPAGIRVNVVAPGPMKTAMLERFSEEEQARLLQEIPLGRFGTGEDFAKLCHYLIVDDCYMTGQVLALNGGFYI